MNRVDLLFLSLMLLPLIGRAQMIDITGEGTPSQTSEWQGGRYPAELAVDGNPNTFSHTDSVTRNNAWQLTFAEDRPIARVEVQMRSDCCGGRMSGAVLRLLDASGDSLFDKTLNDQGPGTLFMVDIPPNLEARTIRIGLENGAPNPGSGIHVVHFGEVRVFGGETASTEIISFTSSDHDISAGESVALSWESKHAHTVTLLGHGPVEKNGSLTVMPDQSTVYQLQATGELGTILESIPVLVDGIPLEPRITEFMALNRRTQKRSDGESPDWIEIWNPNPFAINLEGFQLADEDHLLNPFVFPSLDLAANGYLVIDASASSRDGVPATGFALERSAGAVLQLRNPRGGIIQEFSYPRQREDISFGPVGHEHFYFPHPTPGEKNTGPIVRGFVGDTRISPDRGFYESPQQVEITSQTENAEIFVTLDGSEPGPENARAFRYLDPIPLAESCTLRTRAFKDGLEPTNIDTATYLFVERVASQSSAPDDFPDRWIPNLNIGLQANPVRALASYGLNKQVLASLPLTDANTQAFTLEDALLAIPTLSLAVDAEVLFDPVRGLHVNARQRGKRWERPASIEYLDPASGEHFQADCGLRMHGGWNRFPEMLKKSFRLYFRPEYGDRNFDAPMFPNAPTDEVDRLILRSGNGKCWASPWRALSGGGNSLPRTTYFRDQFARDLQAATGQDHVPGSFVHLYLNGHYWGLYNPVERPDEFLASGHLGGDDDDYDVIKWQRGLGHQVAAGNNAGWLELMALVRGNPGDRQTYREIATRLDLENFVDYLLVNFFLGNQDWVDNNVYAMRNRAAGGPFRFYCWDAEETLLSPGRNSTTQHVADTCTEIHRRLLVNDEYRLLFADRAQKHLFGDGAMTPSSTGALVAGYASLLDRAMVAESARWGALHRPADPYDRRDWLAEVANIQTNYLPRRGATLIAQLRNENLFPAVAAPMILPHREGVVALGTEVTFEAPEGRIYFTSDGSDPRLPGGGISPSSEDFLRVSEESPLLALGSTWSFLDTGQDLGTSEVVKGHPEYDPTHWKHPTYDATHWESGAAPLGYGDISGRTLVTPVGFGGDPGNKFATTYFRTSFEITDAPAVDQLKLRLFRDDGALVYLNGIEVVRSGLPGDRPIVFEDFAETAFNEGEFLEFDLPVEALEEGENVVAVEIHQNSARSSDMGFDLELLALRETTTSTPLLIDGPTTVKARVLSGGEWSPLREAVFQVGDRSRELLISELMYHPVSGGAEFLEIWNRGEVPHLLSDLRITGGITFDFASLQMTNLPAGGRIILVRNAPAFARVYPQSPIAGTYQGALGNGGDQFSLETQSGEVLWTVAYQDEAPWPLSVDGLGRSLTHAGGPFADPISWRPSTSPGGSPGRSDVIPFEPGEDLIDYRLAAMNPRPGGILELKTRLGADAARHRVEWSSDLKIWHPHSVERLTGSPEGDLFVERWQVRTEEPTGPLYYRVRVTLTPP